MPPTRADVARLANVSTATVSYVLNGGPRPVAAETRRRVLEAIAALDYRPNAVARSLIRGRTHALGLIVPDNANPFFAEFGRQVEDRAFERGYAVILCNANLDLSKELAYLDLLLEKQVDGVVVASSRLSPSHLAPLVQRGVPLVVVNPEAPGAGYDSIWVDETGGSYQATWHLVSHGYQVIACVAGPELSRGARKRLDGYLQALAAAGLPCRDDHVSRGTFSAESGYERGRALLSRPDRPRAIFAHSDLLAIGIIRAAWELGLRVPADVAVVGFDDVGLASMVTPALTTVAQPIAAKAQAAVDAILSRLDGDGPAERRDQLLKVELVVRESCGCAGLARSGTSPT